MFLPRLASAVAVCLALACAQPAELDSEESWWSAEFPEQTYAPELRDYAVELHADGVEAVELFARVAHRAAEHWRSESGITARERFDATVRDLGLVFLGSTSYALVDYFPVRFGMLASFHAELERLDQLHGLNSFVALGAGGIVSEDDLMHGFDIDVSACEGFRPELCDGTRNQLYHTFAYVFIAYASNSALITNAGVAWHERTGEAGTLEDLRAGYWGATLGKSLRMMRDSWILADSGVQDMPFLVSAVLARDARLADGRSYGDASLPFNDRDRTDNARAIDDLVSDNIDGVGLDRVLFAIMKAFCDCT